MDAPDKNADFDEAYRSGIGHLMWTDVRVPTELKALFQETTPENALELGCGIGLFSDYFAKEGVKMTSVDFSAVAIQKARERVREGYRSPDFYVGDVTHLQDITGPFDISFDIGCFHCLDRLGQMEYTSEVNRLLKPGGTHLIWAMDTSPRDLKLSPSVIENVFGQHFELVSAEKKRRRLASSHWYRLLKR
ncbi:class I SAM-dependent methyltransferase [Sodalis sp. RH21]|uniref:class I SAM-dependent methyltransferase n=1 Tax=unclassified Sodalis (in: enterobacteria) TaxID=2636512 RepID=UPI0039B636F8